MGNINWLKAGLIGGAIGVLGIPVGYAVKAIRNYANAYRAAVTRFRSAPLLDYDVLPDGSDTLDGHARAEGLKTLSERAAYSQVASENMFGPGVFRTADSQGNVTVMETRWRPDKGMEYPCPVEIPFQKWSGGLPKGMQIRMPDVNGNGRIDSLNDYRTLRKSDIRARDGSNQRAMRDRMMGR